MSLPDFLIIGAPKAGTTALYQYLREHPEIFMPDMKEPNFFGEDENWDKGVDWYQSLFANRTEKRLGEASPIYTTYPSRKGIPERIASLRPDMKLIYLVRHPIERIRSQYEHMKFMRGTAPPIDAAVSTDPEFLDPSRYATQIERYMGCFPKTQMKIVKSEDLLGDRSAVLRSIFEFLEVDPDHLSQKHGVEHHVTRTRRRTRPTIKRLRRMRLYKRITTAMPLSFKMFLDRRTTLLREPPARAESISPMVQAALEERLRDEVARLRNYMGPDFDGWGIA